MNLWFALKRYESYVWPIYSKIIPILMNNAPEVLLYLIHKTTASTKFSWVHFIDESRYYRFGPKLVQPMNGSGPLVDRNKWCFHKFSLILTPKRKNDFDQTIEFQIFEFPFYKIIPYFYFFSRRHLTKLHKDDPF